MSNSYSSHLSRSCCVVEALESRKLLSAALFAVDNLVSDGAVPAAHVDKSLVNPWGVSFGQGGAFWISDNGTGETTLYDGNGVKQKLTVAIPGIGGQPSTPTGQVFNEDGSFNVSKNGKTGAAVFIFATEDGTISGWSPSVDQTHAIIAVNHNPGAVYKGLAIADVKSGQDLFAANFRQGTIDVFDSSFKKVNLPAGAFKDPQVPGGYSPFNVQNIGGKLFVTYAIPDREKGDDVHGRSHGYVDVYDTNGKLLQRFEHGGFDNSPWGMAVAPASFKYFAGDLLVGEFGSGEIDAFDMKTGRFVGVLHDTHGKELVISGIWALTLGTGSSTASTDSLFFTAGTNDEADGLFGKIEFDSFAAKL